MRHLTHSLWRLVVIVGGTAVPLAVAVAVELWEEEHKTAVEFARQGDYDKGLQQLQLLLRQYPGIYPIVRDIVIILSWKPDCQAALRWYERIRTQTQQEPYLIAAVAECQVKMGRLHEARQLTQAGLRRTPADDALRQTRSLLQDHERRQQPRSLEFTLTNNQSDQGNREWLASIQYTQALGDRDRIYTRYLGARAADPEFDTGDLDRVALGWRHDFRSGAYIDQYYAWGTRDKGEGAYGVRLAYVPQRSWHYALDYTGFTEDIPLRARAQDIEAWRVGASIDYEGIDYRHSASLAAARYDFSDDNVRRSAFMHYGYRYQEQGPWEQRLILAWYGSKNTLANTVYYNPSQDASLTLTHKTDYHFDSRFTRHVDHLLVYGGSYYQEDFGSKGIAGIVYEQDYDLDESLSLVVALGHASQVYDGEREAETHFTLLLEKRF